MFRFEIGVQSGKEETLARVGRPPTWHSLFANVRRLVATTAVIVHLDLVAGLPHEDYEGFLDSLQTVFDLLSINDPDCSPFVQVEPLKVLKGSPMRRIARDEGYRFSDTPPYKILSTPWLSFAEIGRIEAISRLIDLFLNSGRFGATLAELARTAPLARIFDKLARFRERGPRCRTIACRAFRASLDFWGNGYVGGWAGKAAGSPQLRLLPGGMPGRRQRAPVFPGERRGNGAERERREAGGPGRQARHRKGEQGQDPLPAIRP